MSDYDLGGKTWEEWEAEHEYWEFPPLTPEGIERRRVAQEQASEQAKEERLVYSRRDGLRKVAQAYLPVLIARDGKFCKRCGTTERLTIDHVIPLARSGSNELDNLQLLCRKCNSAKGARE